MVSSAPSRTIFVIVAASGVLSGTLVAFAAPQEAQRDNLLALAGPERTAAANAPSAIPRVAGFYTLPDANGPGLRVSFVQKAEVLTAIWMTPRGEIYGRGKYLWDPVSGSFKGSSATRNLCLEDQQHPSATVIVREEFYVVNDHELRDRWTKPLAVDCSLGLMEVFKWVDQTWLATDKEWRPLRSRQDSPEILVGAR